MKKLILLGAELDFYPHAAQPSLCIHGTTTRTQPTSTTKSVQMS